jgi:3-hydroxyacyl-[acyl-carrier-protein] dehydratase
VINQPPAPSPDPAWLAGRPVLVPLANDPACCLLISLSDAGLRHAFLAGSVDILDLAREQVAPQLDAGRSLLWRITGGPLPGLPSGMACISTIDRLLGRTDAREPLFIRMRQSADTLHAAFHLPGDFVWLEGHFPGEPILPGIAQLRLAIRMVQTLTGREVQPRAIHQLKFKSPVRPDQILELALRLIDDGGTVLFSIRSARGEHTSGRLAYAAD